ncbi:CsgG/HfaB family protein [Halanaerobium hydrogeniformans]|uniref:Curli production assembly/transport component CsgG n=1 Tax=Halanaerobium hydrogeniformans TaxID=656519 RepID=E4RJ02_HALHG|nr:CsgG/HfaB family protein [Halanaerobium hydrogeniformans]ADQ15222.1 Curli production assembly/transport component CsgG [Halanaerobium hydrogeniformans]
MKRKLVQKVVLLFLILTCFVFIGNTAAEDFQEILNASESILSGKPNVTTATQLLAALPDTDIKIPVAVYEFNDKTGQYQSWDSSVVSRGAADMLTTALLRSRQFSIIDRTIFRSFMNEQNLQSEGRLAPDQGPILGEMSGPKYIITGAITEYQVDMQTGGLGFAIGAIGGTRQKAIASTAIDIRVIDITTGEVVWADSLKGEVEGKKVGLQMFSFFGDNIVELETGTGKQEVINLVLRTLIEEAVFDISNSFRGGL